MGEAFTHRFGGCALTSNRTKGEGEARSPVLWRASHGSVGDKTGSFGAPALKAGFVTD